MDSIAAMNKDDFFSYTFWFAQNCATSIGEIILIKNKEILKDEQDMFYTDSSSDMEKLYQYYEESSKSIRIKGENQ